jgi:hypothetical protein
VHSDEKHQLHTKTTNILSRVPSLCKQLERARKELSASGAARIFCLGADLEKAGACLVAQVALSTPLSLGNRITQMLQHLTKVWAEGVWPALSNHWLT